MSKELYTVILVVRRGASAMLNVLTGKYVHPEKIRRHTNTIRAKREAANTGRDFMWDTVTTQQ